MDWFYFLVLALIELAGTIAFALFLSKTAKTHEIIPMLLCLLLVISYAVYTVLLFDYVFSNNYNSFLLRWNQL